MLGYNFWSEKNHGFFPKILNIWSSYVLVQAIDLEEKFMQTLVLSRNYKNKFRVVVVSGVIYFCYEKSLM
jgi:hypothetical protein